MRLEGNVALCLLKLGRTAAARTRLEKAIALARKHGDSTMEAAWPHRTGRIDLRFRERLTPIAPSAKVTTMEVRLVNNRISRSRSTSANSEATMNFPDQLAVTFLIHPPLAKAAAHTAAV